MSENEASPQTFGQLIADVASWAATRALRQQNVAFGEQLGDQSPKMVAALQRARESLAEAAVHLEEAVGALDAAIGITPAELAQIGSRLDKM
jgi:hypothetical protein